MQIRFFIEGIPAPQGSKIAKCINGRAVMWESSKKVKHWRDTVTAQTRIEMIARGITTTTEPIDIIINFLMPKPKSVTRELPSVKPDLDKLIRAVLDGLTKAGIYKDDAQVVFIGANKLYAKDKVGCEIVIGESNV